MDRLEFGLESEQIALVLLTDFVSINGYWVSHGYCGCFLICIIYCCKALLVTWWVTLSYIVQLCTVVSFRLFFSTTTSFLHQYSWCITISSICDIQIQLRVFRFPKAGACCSLFFKSQMLVMHQCSILMDYLNVAVLLVSWFLSMELFLLQSSIQSALKPVIPKKSHNLSYCVRQLYFTYAF